MGSWSFEMDGVAPVRRAACWRGSGQENLCGTGYVNYTIGGRRLFTTSNIFRRFVGESNTFLTDMHGTAANICH
jgi:hypothetical protein